MLLIDSRRLRAGLFGLGLVASFQLPAFGIVIRHDRDDAKYRELGSGYPAVCAFGGGQATLVGDQWLLTAAHVAHGLSPFAEVRLGDQTYRPVEAVIHPTWSRTRVVGAAVDMALVLLDRPVSGVMPIGLCKGGDEAGVEVLFVGGGVTGDGKTGPGEDDRVTRGATNICEDVTESRLRFRFDPPETATDLEGISGPGDSGGPAFIRRDGSTCIAGVSSMNNSGAGNGLCTYGTDEYYARVSTHIGWIDKTMAKPRGEASAGVETHPYVEASLPDKPSAVVAGAFLAAWVADDFETAIEQFESAHRSKRALRDRPIPERVRNWSELREQWGTITPMRYAFHPDGGMSLLAKTQRAGRVDLHFMMNDYHPKHLDGVRIAMIGE